MIVRGDGEMAQQLRGLIDLAEVKFTSLHSHHAAHLMGSGTLVCTCTDTLKVRS